MGTYRVIEIGQPSPTAFVAWSTIFTTSASATPTLAELQGDTTLGDSSESDSTAEPSPIPTAGSPSSNANAGVVLAPRDILHCVLLSFGIVTVLML
jgi:hypothetical protein